jgi:hypothetical protein
MPCSGGEALCAPRHRRLNNIAQAKSTAILKIFGAVDWEVVIASYGTGLSAYFHDPRRHPSGLRMGRRGESAASGKRPAVAISVPPLGHN